MPGENEPRLAIIVCNVHAPGPCALSPKASTCVVVARFSRIFSRNGNIGMMKMVFERESRFHGRVMEIMIVFENGSRSWIAPTGAVKGRHYQNERQETLRIWLLSRKRPVLVCILSIIHHKRRPFCAGSIPSNPCYPSARNRAYRAA